MPEQITIVGDGAMGTVCALILSGNGHSVRMWSAFSDATEKLRATRENTRFLPGIHIPESVEFTSDDRHCFDGCTLIVSAVPTQYLRSVWTRLAPHLPGAAAIVSCTKGIEIQTRLRPTQVIESVLQAAGKSAGLCALSGPNIAGEIARQLPATAVAASTDPALALLARGLVEITRLGMAMGAQPATFAGLAGMGDLVTTCISPEGRNRSTGEQLGRGKKLQDILSERASVVEGVPTTQAVMQLAIEKGVEMPITSAVHSILFENVTPADALEKLMARQARAEQM